MEQTSTPEWITLIADNDSIIRGISISQNVLHITVECWDSWMIELGFSGYRAMRDISSVSAEIGDIIVEDSPDLSTLAENGFTAKDLQDLKRFIFCDPWDGHVLLEVIAQSVTFKKE